MEYLTELNDMQKQAVTTNSKKVLVVAGAGSGKTKVLITRIKYLIDNHVNRNEIVAFTFTKKAAKEMKDRLIEYRFENVYTFHSFCYQYIIDNPKLFGFKKDDIYVIDDTYKEIFIKNIILDMNIKIEKTKILQYISKRKNNLNVVSDYLEDEALYNQIYFRYQEYLRNAGAIDFDDMVPLFIKYFDTLPFKNNILNNTKYILVDECQDTNQIQYDLIKLLSQNHKNIFMVGDDKQLIYSFRSSDIKIMQDFKNECNEVITLKQNYRSASNILDMANTLIKHNYSDYDNDIFSLIPEKYKIKKSLFESTIDEAERVAYQILVLLNKGIKPKDIAVLYRNNYQSAQIEKALIKYKISYVVYGKKPFYKLTECKRIIAAYRFIKNPNDINLFEILLPYMENDVINNFITKFKKSNKQLLEYAKEYDNEIIKDIAIGLIDLIQNKSKLNKIDAFNEIDDILFKNIKTKQAQHVEVLRDIIISSEYADESETLNELMVDDTVNDKGVGVRLLTIHKAKGLEFKCVFLISLNEGILPAITKTNEQLEEERRLCYVAITRAKEFLHISSADYHFINGIRKRLRPSVFMSEIK